MIKILVTGANGFVGQHLVTYLKELHGEQIQVYTTKMLRLEKSHSWNNLPKVDVLVHLASQTGVIESIKNPSHFITSNYCMTVNALEYCKKFNSHLIFPSTSSYDPSFAGPYNENIPLIEANPYSYSKIACEDVCKFYSKQFNVPVSVIRPFNIYGPGQTKEFLIPKMVDQALNGRIITIMDARPQRDYLYISDFVLLLYKVLKRGVHNNFEIFNKKKKKFNAGSGKSYSVQNVFDILNSQFDKTLSLDNKNIYRKNEIMFTRADIRKIKQVTSWEPTVSIDEGIKKLVTE